jgi:hypothetical protein
MSLSRRVRDWYKGELVDNTIVAAMVARVDQSGLATLRWKRQRGVHELITPYGPLHVYGYVGGSREVQRDGARLIHIDTKKRALFASVKAANTNPRSL